jgi:hypothetical protein
MQLTTGKQVNRQKKEIVMNFFPLKKGWKEKKVVKIDSLHRLIQKKFLTCSEQKVAV